MNGFVVIALCAAAWLVLSNGTAILAKVKTWWPSAGSNATVNTVVGKVTLTTDKLETTAGLKVALYNFAEYGKVESVSTIKALLAEVDTWTTPPTITQSAP